MAFTSTFKKLATAVGLAILVTFGLVACSANADQPQAPTAADVWIKAVPNVDGAMSDMTGMFGVFSNPTDKVIYILGGSATDATLTDTKLDAHEVVKTADGKMEMQEVRGGIPIPAHGSVTLKPGSYHIMFWNLKKPIAVGDEISATIKFSNGTTTEVKAIARDIANYAG